VAARGVISVISAEHADQLGDHVGLGELDDGGAGGIGGGVLDNREVTIAKRSDLREVRDAQQLPGLTDRAQPLADRARRMATDTSIDLIENKRGMRTARGICAS